MNRVLQLRKLVTRRDSCGTITAHKKAAVKSAIRNLYNDAWTAVWALPETNFEVCRSASTFCSTLDLSSQVAAIRSILDSMRDLEVETVKSPCSSRVMPRRTRSVETQIEALHTTLSALLDTYPSSVLYCSNEP